VTEETVWPGWSASVIFGVDIVRAALSRVADPESRSPWKFCDPVSTEETAAAAAVPTMATNIAMVVPSTTIPAGSR